MLHSSVWTAPRLRHTPVMPREVWWPSIASAGSVADEALSLIRESPWGWGDDANGSLVCNRVDPIRSTWKMCSSAQAFCCWSLQAEGVVNHSCWNCDRLQNCTLTKVRTSLIWLFHQWDMILSLWVGLLHWQPDHSSMDHWKLNERKFPHLCC